MDNLFMENEKPATLQDIALKTGVSPTTVSRVVNNNPSVKPDVRLRVEEAIREMKYERGKTASSKKSRLSNTVGLIVPDILNPFFPLLIKGIENVARIQGFSIILCDSENDCDEESTHVQTLLEKGIDGLIFIPAPGKNALVEDLIEGNFPLVFLDRKVDRDRINFVTSANEEGAYTAVKYLITLGHREIVFIGGQEYLSTQKERFAGYRRALEEENIPLDDALILPGQHSWEKSYGAVSGLIGSGKRFSAIFATSDMMAFGAKQAVQDANMKIPGDVSIIGFDDIPFSSAISLTTVSQPAFEMGKNAMLLLIDLINRRVQTPHHIVLRTSMVIRESCGKR
jgi:LacI family transcriptional regulator